MLKGLSGVGLMDLGTLDAIKKLSAAKITQTSSQIPQKNAELATTEGKEEVFKSSSDGQVITYPQPC